MSIRHVLKTVGVSGAATVLAAVFALGVGAGTAGASLTSGDGNTTLSTTANCGSPPAPCTITPGTPFTSGQIINVGVAANSVLSSAALAAFTPTIPALYQSGNFYLEECTDVGGTTAGLPTGPSGCEAATLLTTGKTSTGGFSKNFTVYDLPDFNTLGTPTMTGSCDVAPNTCVVGIFISNPQSVSGTFGYPHLFSAPFQMSVGDGADVGNNPGDGTPEVPLAIGLPLAALAVFGGFTLRNRRRRRQAA
jgi:hypothetical protein